MRYVILTIIAGLLLCTLTVLGINEESLLASGTAVTYSTPAPLTPTNLGIQSVSWWCVETNYVTNSSTWVSMADLYSSYNLTNRGASTIWPGRDSGNLNGHPFLHFVQADGEYLFNDGYTVSQPDEVVLVMCALNTDLFSWNVYIDGNANRQLFADNGNVMKANAGGATPTGPTMNVTNKWCVWNIVFNGAASKVYTNGILAWTADFGSGAAGGFSIGIYQPSLFGPASMYLAEASTYSATLGSVDTTVGNFTASSSRSNIVYYYTNKYAISP